MPYVDLSELESYGENISTNLETGNMVRARRIPGRVSRKLNYIKLVTSRISTHQPNYDKQPKVFEWICDNRYLAEREGRGAALALKGVGKLRGAKNGLPKVFVLAVALIQSGKGHLSAERIEAFLRGAQRSGVFSETELWIFIVMLKVGLVYELASLCEHLEPLLENPDSGPLFDLSQHSENIFTSLRLLTNTDFRPLLHRLSTVEKILNGDPSGTYPLMDEETRSQYRREVSRLAEKLRMSEQGVAKSAVKLAGAEDDAAKRHVGYFLLTKPLGNNPSPVTGYVYFISLSLLTGILFFTTLPFTGIVASLLLLIPVSDVAKNLVDACALKMRHPTRVPRLRLCNGIPASSKTLCVISVLLTSPDNSPAYASLLERYMLANRDAGDNLLFGILGDFKDSDSQTDDSDTAILQSAKEAIEALNMKYGYRFYLFTRNRVQNTDGKYTAWERKRGALLQLTDMLLGKGDRVLVESGDPAKLPGTKYVITLDSDTKLNIGSAAELVGTMMHPLNKPVVDPSLKIVTGGHALLQPRVSVDLEAASKSLFSRALAGLGGTDPYCSTVSDLYQDLFDEGSFVGKGIFDVDAFSQCLTDRFPENLILSHDLLEGCYLRSGLVSDVELSDGFPHTVSSYFKRQHRWTRGDWQLSPWLFKRVPIRGGKREDNPISPLSRWKIADNLRRSLVPVFTFIALLIGMFYGKLWPAAAVAVSIYLSNLLLSTAAAFFKGGVELGSRYHSSILYGLRGSLVQTLIQLMLLPYSALLNISAILTSLYRMTVSKKRLLTWVTAAQASSSPNSVLSTVKQMYFPVITGFVALMSSNLFIAKPLGLLWILSPIISFFISRPASETSKLTGCDKDFLKHHSGLMWGYFSDFLNDKNNYLPPDNWQQQPAVGVASRTSPTNIGLALLSCMSASDLGIISCEHAVDLMIKMVSSVSKLRKWNGHLLNWYDTETLQPLYPLTVSSVDSGNYAAALITLIQGLKDFKCEGSDLLSIRLSQLLDDMDFAPLYDTERKLFYISLDTETGLASESWYDLLASEARQTSYICIARGQVERKHWGSLGRALVMKNGYSGMASWTGTMFEYLMPNLLMPTYKNSLIYESLMFCVYCQKLRGDAFRIPWGTSESAYFSFDRLLNYRYKAHGVQRLGFKRGLNRELVVSPYSSFLALEVSPVEAIKNLRKLSSLGLADTYGFYEAADFTPSRLIGTNKFEPVKCFMAHHIGMSLLACNNAINDRIMQKRFMSNPEMAAYSELLEERTPVDAITVKSGHKDVPEKPRRYGDTPWSRSNSGYDPLLPRSMFLSNGSYSVLATDLGHTKSSCDGLLMTKFDASLTGGVNGIHFFIKTDKSLIPLTPLPQLRPDVNYSSEFDERTVRYSASHGSFKLSLTVSVSPVDKAELREVKLLSDVPVTCELICYFEPVLSPQGDYDAHPAFSKLFIQTASTDSGLVISRRDKTGTTNLFSAFLCSEARFDFDTSRERALGRGGFSNLPGALNQRRRSSEGSVLDPCVLMSVPLKLDGGSLQTVLFSLSCASDRFSALSAAERALTMPVKLGANHLFTGPGVQNLTPGHISDAFGLISDMTFFTPARRAMAGYIEKNVLSQRDLWKFGISGDLPILSVVCPPRALTDFAERAIRQHRFLSQGGINFDLVLLLTDMNDYNRPTKTSAFDLIGLLNGENTIGRNGGIHLVEVDEGTADYNLLISCSFNVIGDAAGTRDGHNRISRKDMVPPLLRAHNSASLRNPHYNEDGSFSFNTGAELPSVTWSNLLVNEKLGMVSTDSGSGYMWYLNARENRINAWTNDPLLIDGEERIFLVFPEGRVSLFSAGDNYECTVTHGFGYSVWEKQLDGGLVRTTAFVHKDHPIRMIKVEYSGTKRPYISYFTGLSLGDKAEDRRHIETSHDKGLFRVQNNFHPVFREHPVLVSSVPECLSYTCDRSEYAFGIQSSRAGAGYDPCINMNVPLKDGSALILLGVTNSGEGDDLLKGLTTESFDTVLSQTKDHWKDLITPIVVRTPSDHLNHYLNGWALYQTIACRILGRTSIYQSGGAYGFRDQLQDIVAAVYADPQIAKRRILDAAAHQFEEGDVQHWWHPETHGDTADKGVRTRCSDDLLWLPYTVCEYVNTTGDAGILDVVVPFIKSPPLADYEQERYEIPEKSSDSATIYAHCTRAIDLVIRRGFGSHGLCFIGSGDWNDGFNEVGKNGAGESTWLTWFFSIVLGMFGEICILKDDQANRTRFISLANKTVKAAEASWDGEWYTRGYFDNGNPIGSASSDECKIDSIAQSFSALAGSDAPKSLRGVKSAIAHLVDRENRIVKLFTPPFQDSDENPGYIKGYPRGVRENGGQYTHASVWLAMACFKLGLAENGYEILDILLPSTHKESAYKGEPYVLAADVYSSDLRKGRGGWTWYTGSSSWYYAVACRDLLGINIRGGKLLLNPNIPAEWDSFTATVRFGGSHWDIRVQRTGTKALTIDSVPADPSTPIPRGNHSVILTL